LRKSPMIVIILSLTAIALYWTPLPSIGGLILGGYPWIAPDDAKPIFFGIGIVATVILLLLSGLTFYFSKKIEELDSLAERIEETPEFEEEYGFTTEGSQEIPGKEEELDF